MKEHRRNVLVGTFMVAGLGALGVLMVMFGEAPEWLGGAEWELEIQVRQLRGAAEGTPVNLNGVQIGRVGAAAEGRAKEDGKQQHQPQRRPFHGDCLRPFRLGRYSAVDSPPATKRIDARACR